jgi:cytochrome c biogenesis protein CcmG/thiol:disulfide interchange protein DsbE
MGERVSERQRPGDGNVPAAMSHAERACWFAGHRRVVLAGVLGVLMLGLLGSVVLRVPPFRGQASAVANIGQPAPDFTLSLFNGKTFRLAEHRGQPVVINFWASWCTPCRAEMPDFEKIYQVYRERGIVFVGVAVRDDPAAARGLLDELAITYPAGIDEDDAISRPYRLIGMPMTVFIDPAGTVVDKHTGALSEAQLVRFVEEMAR